MFYTNQIIYQGLQFPPKLKALIYNLICVKHIFYPATIKNDNESFAMRIFLAAQMEATTPSIFKKDDIGK